GRRWPGWPQLAELRAASRMTLKPAMNELADAGPATRHRGGRTVVAPQVELPVVTGSFSALMDSLKTMGHETQVELLESRSVAADSDVAHALAVSPGAPVRRIIRLRRLGETPFSYLVSWLPEFVASGCDDAAFAEQSMLDLLERAGATPHEAELWISSVGADTAAA